MSNRACEKCLCNKVFYSFSFIKFLLNTTYNFRNSSGSHSMSLGFLFLIYLTLVSPGEVTCNASLSFLRLHHHKNMTFFSTSLIARSDGEKTLEAYGNRKVHNSSGLKGCWLILNAGLKKQSHATIIKMLYLVEKVIQH